MTDGQGTFDSECGTADLTPDRLASFYQKVGGNYDTLFLQTRSPSLSFIYQSLGCFHSLQPSTNAFEPPSIPALLPNGFVRWQTIQILLDPDEHSQYLQNAVAQWDIPDPDGSTFPKSIPRDAFPSKPDSEMVRWHQEVSRRLEYDYWKRNTPRVSPSVGSHYNYVSPDGLSEGYFARTRKSDSPHHRRHTSAEYPLDPRHRPNGRPGYSSRGASPHPPDRAREKRRVFRTPFGSFSFGAESDASSEDSGLQTRGKRSGRRNLGVEGSHGRCRSHDAYLRKPRRDQSPDGSRRHSYREAHYTDHPYLPRDHDRRGSVRFVDPDAAHPYGIPGYARRPDLDRRASHSGSSGRSGSSSERTRYGRKWNAVPSPGRVPVSVAEGVQ